MGLSLKTAPATEPITLAQAKLYLRVDDTADNDLITTLITVARERAEEFTKRAFITQTWNYWLDRFPMGHGEKWWQGVVQGHMNMLNGGRRDILIPRPPLISITHLKTYNDANTATTYSADNYIVDTASKPGRLCLENSQTWPTDLRRDKAIDIEFVCGYGTNATDVPAAIRAAIYAILAKLYECRGADDGAIPKQARELLEPYKVLHVGELNPTAPR